MGGDTGVGGGGERRGLGTCVSGRGEGGGP